MALPYVKKKCQQQYSYTALVKPGGNPLCGPISRQHLFSHGICERATWQIGQVNNSGALYYSNDSLPPLLSLRVSLRFPLHTTRASLNVAVMRTVGFLRRCG